MALLHAGFERRTHLNMHISDKLAEAHKLGKPAFSFEFFPPKTAQVRLVGDLLGFLYADMVQGVQNLYDRMNSGMERQ